MALTRGELARKVVHMGVGTIAFSLRYLGPFWAAILAAGALGFNLFLLPRIGGRKLWRQHEVESGASIGIILYPLAVLLLILVFYQRLEVAAAAWGILAFGDGMASVVGMSIGRRKLPWNPRKSWMGSLAYVLFGTLAAAVLLVWTAPAQDRAYGWAFALAACLATALLAAALESLPQGLDDNLGVPLVSGLFLLGLVLTQGRWDAFLADPGLPMRLAIAAAANAALAGAAYAARTVNRSGVVAGFLVGFLIYAFLGLAGLSPAARLLRHRQRGHQARLPQEGRRQARPGGQGAARSAPRPRQRRRRHRLRPVRGGDPLPRALRPGLRRRLRHRRRRHRVERDRPAPRPPHLPRHHLPPGAARHRGRGLAGRDARRDLRLAGDRRSRRGAGAVLVEGRAGRRLRRLRRHHVRERGGRRARKAPASSTTRRSTS